MIRIIIGSTIDFFAILWLLVALENNADSAEIFTTLLVIISGGILIYYGIKAIKVRQAVIIMTIDSIRTTGNIDYDDIHKKLKVNEYKARKLILWGYNKNLFFELSKDGVMQPKGLFNNKLS